MRRTALAARGVLLLVCALLAGCSAPPAPAATPHPGEPLSFEIYQGRSDYGIRQLQIKVTNPTDEDIVIDSLSFAAGQFAGPVSAARAPYTIPGGLRTDFPVLLPDTVCAPAAVDAGMVRAEFLWSNGDRGSFAAIPEDPIGSLRVIRTKDCAEQSFQKVARIELATHLRYGRRNDKPLALLDIGITPTGAAGSVTLDAIQSTILLQQLEGELRPFEQSFSARTKPTTITLSLIPTRCDTHVIAEDKVGTLIPFHVSTESIDDAMFTVSSPPELKTELYSFVERYCG